MSENKHNRLTTKKYMLITGTPCEQDGTIADTYCEKNATASKFVISN